MPPGAKKRKANKKNKGKVPNSHSTTNNQQVLENDDLKTHDEKDSDGGEINSPKSQPDHSLLTENEEQGELHRKDRDSHLSASVVIADSKPMEVSQNGAGNGEAESKQKEVPEEAEVVQDIEVTRVLKPEEGEMVKDIQVTSDSESKDASIESVERDAGSSSSSSSSDDESPLADQNSQVIEAGKMEEEEKGGDSVTESMPAVDLAGKLGEMIVTSVMESATNIDLTGKLGEMIFTSVMESATNMDLTGKLGKKIVTSVMETATNIDLTGKLEEKKSAGSVMETEPTVDLAEPVVLLTEEGTQAFASGTVVDTGLSNEISLTSKVEENISLPLLNKSAGASDVIESVAKENENKMLQPSDTPIVETNGTGSSELPKDPEIPESSENQVEEDISLPLLNKSAGASDVIESVAKENENKMLQPSDTPIVETNGTGSSELPKDPEIPESSENQVEEDISLPLLNKSAGASDVIELVAKENENKMLQPSDTPIVKTNGTGSSELPKDPEIPQSLENQVEEDISLPLLNKIAGASDVIESVAKENENKMLQPSDTPIVETNGTGGSELPKDSEIPESSENQPLLGKGFPAVERSSWKSCCGIFDVLKGSNR
ncbi:hypothetical protein NE237_002093 [Protea cynaroides]|uniref:Uncharacterized protein n=1 Tax=Protea cynaroides TaxID=273540 RepID=A0A9Q0KUB5_9MAGN|nr:hypothetical protein NE237_002093 [Protea cynaroides]